MLGKAIKKKKTTKSKQQKIDPLENESLLDFIKVLSVAKMLGFRESQITSGGGGGGVEKIDPTVLWIGSSDTPIPQLSHIKIEQKDNTLDAFQYVVELSHDIGNSISFSHFRMVLDTLDYESCFNFLEWIEQKGWKFPVCIVCVDPIPFIPLLNRHEYLVLAPHSSLSHFYVQSMNYRSKSNRTFIHHHTQSTTTQSQMVNGVDQDDTIEEDTDEDDQPPPSSKTTINKSDTLLSLLDDNDNVADDDGGGGGGGDSSKTPVKASNRTTVLKNMFSTPSPNKTTVVSHNINTNPNISPTNLVSKTSSPPNQNGTKSNYNNNNNNNTTQILTKSGNHYHNNKSPHSSTGDDPILLRISAQNTFLSMPNHTVITTGRVVSVQLHLRDALDNPVQTNLTSLSPSGTGPVSSNPIHIYLEGPHPVQGPHPVYIYVVGPGTLGVSFLPTHNGVYSLHADIDSTPIKHSPCTLNSNSNGNIISSPSSFVNTQQQQLNSNISSTSSNNSNNSTLDAANQQKKRKQRFSTGSTIDPTQQPEEDDLLDIFSSPSIGKFSKSSNDRVVNNLPIGDSFNITDHLYNNNQNNHVINNNGNDQLLNGNNNNNNNYQVQPIRPLQILNNNLNHIDKEKEEEEEEEKEKVIISQDKKINSQIEGTPATLAIEETQMVEDKSIEATLAIQDTPELERTSSIRSSGGGGNNNIIINSGSNSASSQDIQATLVMDDL
ncbi:hypothetical protein DFA_09865 [Cavenderia fasciculata]|uniref:Uncharacterized protein n=1 Tax=Cavenderia fasciculata TaxID=261658 RepID=F4QAY3_CACFS|nr:uncharacterized protein DFA_09865 [Cavenderia fasciculata]EGG15042.1 hypothetical protein DFA_09865 [Cavenderia fasciculata]|eukprot:XP_004351762.1 hypothetical protein DFA_09865 [Cavenderia fasciculata]